MATKKREMMLPFFAGLAVSGAFFAGLGMSQAGPSQQEPLRYVSFSDRAKEGYDYAVLREDGAIFWAREPTANRLTWKRPIPPGPVELP